MQGGYKVGKRTSQKMFKRNANRTHYFNIQHRPMRGGYRL